MRDGACADFLFISNHIAFPIAQRQNNTKVLSMFEDLSRAWPYWDQKRGRRHLMLVPCDVGPAQCMYEHPIGRKRLRRQRRQRSRHHRNNVTSSAQAALVALGLAFGSTSSTLRVAPDQPLPDAIDPTSPTRTIGFLTPNGSPGSHNHFLAGLDIRLPQDEEHECGVYCGVPRRLRWQLGHQTLRRHSPWALSDVAARDEALRRPRPIRLFWAGSSAGERSQRGLLLRHHLNRSGFVLRDTSPSGLASGRASAVDVDPAVVLYAGAAELPARALGARGSTSSTNHTTMRKKKSGSSSSSSSSSSSESIRSESRRASWVARMMSSSDFCYSPLGQLDGDSDRYLPAILYGCVPIFVSRDRTQVESGPYAEAIAWREVALHVTREELTTLHDRLQAISHERLLAMRRAMAVVWPRLLWSRAKPTFPRPSRHARPGSQFWPYLTETPEQPDAFSTLLEQLRGRLDREERQQ